MVEQERKKLADAPDDKTFITQMGKEIKNLKELSKTLNDTPIDSFALHVNENKNDFANWIKNVLEDNELAEELYKTTEIKKTKELVKARIKWLEKEISRYETQDESSKKLTEKSIEVGLAPSEKTKTPMQKTTIPKAESKLLAEKNKTSKPSKEEKIAAPPEATFPTSEISSAISEVQNNPTKQAPVKKETELHPVAHFKSNIRQAILGGLIGLILGLIIGFTAASLLVCGR